MKPNTTVFYSCAITSSPERSEDSVLIDPPFQLHLNIELYFSFLF